MHGERFTKKSPYLFKGKLFEHNHPLFWVYRVFQGFIFFQASKFSNFKGDHVPNIPNHPFF